MKTYIYDQKNGGATLIISAEYQEEADEIFEGLVKDVEEFRMTEVHDED
jgi:predicted 3-demethylubiquinone-9 3-methyltransferase (glyoxalase superfamily)